MKHQGQTMSETSSMATLGLAFMRWSFLLGLAAICPGADCEMPHPDIITSHGSFVDLFGTARMFDRSVHSWNFKLGFVALWITSVVYYAALSPDLDLPMAIESRSGFEPAAFPPRSIHKL